MNQEETGDAKQVTEACALCCSLLKSFTRLLRAVPLGLYCKAWFKAIKKLLGRRAELVKVGSCPASRGQDGAVRADGLSL